MVSTMKDQLKLLYELQQVDIQIASEKRSLEQLDSGETLKRQVLALETKLASLTSQLRKLEAELKDKELQLKTVEEKKESFDKKLYGGQITNPKELSSIEKEIAMLQKNRGDLDESILKLYDDIDQQKTEVERYRAGIARGESKLSVITDAYNSAAGDLNANMQVLMRSRETIVSTVTDKSLLQRYESTRSKMKDTGLAVIENGRCGGCHTGVTPYQVRLVIEDESLQTCENCGRILYHP